jgi:hypothetical protein
MCVLLGRVFLTAPTDCFTDRDMFLIDEMNPGPDLRANVGDTVRITVVNHSPTNAIGIHFHGLLMTGQPYADGVFLRRISARRGPCKQQSWSSWHSTWERITPSAKSNSVAAQEVPSAMLRKATGWR